ncbi:hypothetical protein C8F01DRAFT_1080684 [Mycena amicta]|nr:hypothetical protein C8F01DRAFT_1080684 [Mycena amicta]
MGLPSPFTKEQKTHIEAACDEFAGQLRDGTLTDKDLKQWKESKARDLMALNAFKSLDFNVSTREEWFNKIVRKFHNHRAKLAKKAPGESSDGAIQSAQSHPLLAFAAPVSARKIFEDEQKDAIMTEVDSRLASEPHSNKVAMYQSVLKEHWNELDSAQSEWEAKAASQAGDIETWEFVIQNQTEFIGSTTLALRKLCSSKTLGGAGNSREEQFCASAYVIPLRLILRLIDGQGPFNPKANAGIPRNASGQPIFPLVNLDDLSAPDMRAVLTEYLNEYWAHQRSSPEAPSIPWGALGENPETYFDTARFKFFGCLGPGHFSPPVVEEPKQIGGKALKRKAKADAGDHHKEPAGKRKRVIPTVEDPHQPRRSSRATDKSQKLSKSKAGKNSQGQKNALNPDSESAAGFTWMKMATKSNRINLAVGINPVQPRLNDIQQLWHSTARLHGLNGVRLILVYGSYKPGNQSTLARLDGQGLSEAGRVAAGGYE